MLATTPAGRSLAFLAPLATPSLAMPRDDHPAVTLFNVCPLRVHAGTSLAHWFFGKPAGIRRMAALERKIPQPHRRNGGTHPVTPAGERKAAAIALQAKKILCNTADRQSKSRRGCQAVGAGNCRVSQPPLGNENPSSPIEKHFVLQPNLYGVHQPMLITIDNPRQEPLHLFCTMRGSPSLLARSWPWFTHDSPIDVRFGGFDPSIVAQLGHLYLTLCVIKMIFAPLPPGRVVVDSDAVTEYKAQGYYKPKQEQEHDLAAVAFLLVILAPRIRADLACGRVGCRASSFIAGWSRLRFGGVCVFFRDVFRERWAFKFSLTIAAHLEMGYNSLHITSHRRTLRRVQTLAHWGGNSSCV
ncbi:hypothetical protein EDB92DRAFT_2104254 [Lactarius akahatsu]|uniref:Uncharacterized protein n=1 Tax=Lactarius akahatsu TaxID=416441 RepID=A0AAD4LHG1_9AGAM|nr:hypothetical protein EDB92DRAFT_2104254 [Lactarius akahatsu]